jgi:acyl-CoA synthetase (AMP-forming)/AMP-acid ligase II
MQLTSGTTASPRICVWDQRSLLYGIDSGMSAMGLCRDDVCLSWVPFYHDLGLVNNLLLCLANDIPLVVMEAADFVRNPAVWLKGSRPGRDADLGVEFRHALAVEKVALETLEGVSLERSAASGAAESESGARSLPLLRSLRRSASLVRRCARAMGVQRTPAA